MTKRFVWPFSILLFVVVLFGPALIGGLVPIGNSDRLDTYLNIRLSEIDAIREFGRVPTWNDRMFMGFNTTALHYMIPAVQPISWAVAAIGTSYPFFFLSLYAILQYAAAGLVMYFLLRDLTQDPPIAATGAIIYLTGYQVYFRSFQVEDAGLNYVMLPLAILTMRKLVRQSSTGLYFLLFIVFLVMMASFLQETSYAFLALGAYFLYLLAKKAPPRVLAGIAAMVLCAVVAGSPRIVGIAQDLHMYARDSQLGVNAGWEALRLVYEGLFGRSFEEARRTTHLHVHEGFAVYSSMFVLPILLWLGPRVATIWENLTIAGLAAIVVAGALSVPWIQPVLIMAWLLATERLGRGSNSRQHIPGRSDDLLFFAGMSWLLALVILTPRLRAALYELYLEVDFSHSRLSFVFILAISTAVAIVLARFWRASFDDRAAGVGPNRESRATEWRWLPAFLLLAWLCDHLVAQFSEAVFGHAPILVSVRGYAVILQQAAYLIGVLAIFAILTFGVWVMGKTLSIRRLYVVCMCAFLVATGGSFTYRQILGADTRTFPTPFWGHNMLTVPGDVFRLPSDATLTRVHEKLENDAYRSVFVLNEKDYLPFVESFLSQFWRIRSVDGYVPGVPKELGDLPWAQDVAGKRTIRFSRLDQLTWPTLAFVNAKHAVIVDHDFFFNVRSPTDHSDFDPDAFVSIENPLHVVPRAFFAESLQPARHVTETAAVAYEGDAVAGSKAEDGKDFPEKSLVTLDGALLPIDPRRVSIADDIQETKEFAPGSGLRVDFQQDEIVAHMDPADGDRLLVLNELYHPSWRARADGRDLRVLRVNQVMRGVVVPKDATEVVFRFVPFLAMTAALSIFIFGVAMAAVLAFFLGRGNLNAGRLQPTPTWQKR